MSHYQCYVRIRLFKRGCCLLAAPTTTASVLARSNDAQFQNLCTDFPIWILNSLVGAELTARVAQIGLEARASLAQIAKTMPA